MAFTPTNDSFQPINDSGFTPTNEKAEKPSKGVVKAISKAAPTVGGILGGIAGAIVGAPMAGVGALATGAAGTAAGTGAGLAIGESLENLAGAQEETPQQLAREAVVEPLKAGAIDFAVGSAVQAAKPVLKAGAKVGKGVARIFIPKNASEKLVANSFKSSASMARKINVNKVSKQVVEHGLEGDLDDFIRTANTVTGADGTISKITRNIAGRATTPVASDDAIKAIRNAADVATQLTDKEQARFVRHANSIINQGLEGGEQIGKMSTIDALDTMRNLEDVGYSYLEKASSTLDGVSAKKLEQQARIYIDAADEIANQIDKLSIAEDLIDSFKTPEIIAQLNKASAKTANAFMKAKTFSEVRNVASFWTQLSRLSKATLEAQNSLFYGTSRRAIQEALSRPESATAIAGAIQDVSQSGVGRAARAVGSAVTPLARPAGAVAERLPQLFSQLGLGAVRE